MPLLFSYGTRQRDNVRLAKLGRLPQGQRDELLGCERSLAWIEDLQVVATSGETHHANVTRNGRNDSRVRGTVSAITDAGLAAADQWGQLAAYKRADAMLASGKPAWVYVDRLCAGGFVNCMKPNSRCSRSAAPPLHAAERKRWAPA